MRRVILCVFMVLLTLTAVTPQNAIAALVIDSFTSIDPNALPNGYRSPCTYGASDPGGWSIYDTGWSISPNAADSDVTVSETGLSDVIGGTRYTSAQWTATTGNSVAMYIGSWEGSTGFSFLNTGAGTNYGTVSITYDGDGSGLYADFSDESKLRVRFDPDHLAFGKNSIMSVTLSDGTNTDTEVVSWLNPDDYVSQPGVLNVDFLLADYDGVNLESIRSLVFSYEGDYSNDVSFQYIAAVPVPGAVWLLGSCLVGVVGLRKLKK